MVQDPLLVSCLGKGAIFFPCFPVCVCVIFFFFCYFGSGSLWGSTRSVRKESISPWGHATSTRDKGRCQGGLNFFLFIYFVQSWWQQGLVTNKFVFYLFLPLFYFLPCFLVHVIECYVRFDLYVCLCLCSSLLPLLLLKTQRCAVTLSLEWSVEK